MSTYPTNAADAMMDGIRSVMMPQESLDELRAEMRQRNESRLQLVRNLSRSTSKAYGRKSRNASRKSSN